MGSGRSFEMYSTQIQVCRSLTDAFGPKLQAAVDHLDDVAEARPFAGFLEHICAQDETKLARFLLSVVGIASRKVGVVEIEGRKLA